MNATGPPSPSPPHSINAVVLTHAHLDHTGYVPALVRDGFSGPVFATDGTTDLCKLILPDSGYLQEEEARYATHRGSSRHSPALPIYTAADAVKSLNSFKVQDFDAPLDLGGGMELTFLPAGHILAQRRSGCGSARTLCTSPGTWAGRTTR